MKDAVAREASERLGHGEVLAAVLWTVMRKNSGAWVALAVVLAQEDLTDVHGGVKAMCEANWAGAKQWQSNHRRSKRVVGTVPEHEGGRDSPEHESGRNSPRARWWSGQSLSTRVVGTIPKHKKCGKKPYATYTIILCIIYLLVLSSPI